MIEFLILQNGWKFEKLMKEKTIHFQHNCDKEIGLAERVERIIVALDEDDHSPSDEGDLAAYFPE